MEARRACGMAQSPWNSASWEENGGCSQQGTCNWKTEVIFHFRNGKKKGNKMSQPKVKEKELEVSKLKL
jgi:hypothetical protein